MGDTMNLGRLLSDVARRLPERRGLVWGAQSWTWAEIDARVDALVAALAARGLGKGDKLLVHARNCNQLFESQWAAFKLGAVWVPTNVRLTPPEVGYLARNSDAEALIYEDAFPEHADATGLDKRIAIGQPRSGEDAYEALVAEHAGAQGFEAEVSRNDPCWFFYTSGTTGKPKGGVLTHGQMAFVVTNHIADLMPDTGPEDVSLVVAPLSHGAGAHVSGGPEGGAGQAGQGDRAVLRPGRGDGKHHRIAARASRSGRREDAGRLLRLPPHRHGDRHQDP